MPMVMRPLSLLPIESIRAVSQIIGRTARRIDRARSHRGGFTLVELLVTMSLLTLVVGGITGTLVSATRHEAALNVEFQAQESVRLALSRIRSDLHCASAVAPSSGASSSITLALPTGCASGSGSFTWCTVSSGGGYDLWRTPGTSCSTAGASRRWAQGLRAAAVFTPDASVHTGAPVLPDVAVRLAVTAGNTRTYRLSDTIFLRNGTRQ